jgi:hypothetical protein
MKKRYFLLFYFIVQLPIAILAIRGFRLTDIMDKSGETPVSISSIRNGEYVIYDYTSARETGGITIKSALNNNDIFVSIKTVPSSGKDEIFNKEYHFINMDVSDLHLERRNYKEEFYWMGKNDSINLIIVNIANDFYHNPIPSSMLDDDKIFFFYNAIGVDYYNFIEKEVSSAAVSKIVFNEASNSISSGIFFVEFGDAN